MLKATSVSAGVYQVYPDSSYLALAKPAGPILDITILA